MGGPKGNFKCLLYFTFYERERERERALFGGGEQKKKKIIDAHIHIIPEMNTWQFYKLAIDISFAHQISCTYSKEKKIK